MAGGAQDKTEQPTPKRKQEAKKKGEVAKSTEVNSALLLFGGALTLLFSGPMMLKQFEQVCVEMFGNAHTYPINPSTLPGMTWQGSKYMLKGLFPMLVVMILLGLIASFGQVGIRVVEEAMKPKWSKLNPLKGLKQIFSMRGFVEMVKGLVKMIIVLSIAFFVLKAHHKEFFLIASQGVHGIVAFSGKVGFEIFIKVAIALMFLAAMDYTYQRYRHNKDLKMTKQEVKEEHKQMEGDPLIKSRIRSLQEEMARKRMMQKVPEADVVITNPTHYAVALKYEDQEMEAPKVVAKGMRKIAERIKAIAGDYNIPVIENAPLARSLYDAVEIDQEIPANFYRAIAEILAQIYKMRKH